MNKPTTPKGMRDFSPDEMAGRDYIFNTIKKWFLRFGFQPIETPAMELLSVLTGKYGEEGDKLLYKVLNSGDFMQNAINEGIDFSNSRQLTTFIAEKGLKYDLTVPFARFVVEHFNELVFPFKRYQIQPVWRADRPQKGRYREFYQCDADVIGSDSLLYEYELITLVNYIFNDLGVETITKLNHRKLLFGITEILNITDRFIDFTVIIDKLDKIGNENVCNELATLGISNENIEIFRKIIEYKSSSSIDKLNFIAGLLSHSEQGIIGISELREVIGYCNSAGLTQNIEIDLSLARGLNYYTGTIIEVKAKDLSMGSICGGGRYDDLTGVFGMPGMSGIGISFGADRIYDVIKSLNKFPETVGSSSQVMFVNFGKDETNSILAFAEQLRKKGISTEIYPDAHKMKKQLSYAADKKIAFVILAGKNELESGKFALKNMNTSEQQLLSFDEIVQLLSTSTKAYE